MQHNRIRRALGLGTATALIAVGGAYAIGSTAVSVAAPIDEHGRPDVVPAGPATLPTQAADRARQAIAERGRDAHAQGPKAEVTTEGVPAGDPPEAPTDESTEGGGPGYGPGVHAGPHGDYGPDVHPDSENHPGGDDHPDADNRPDTTNHPGSKPTQRHS